MTDAEKVRLLISDVGGESGSDNLFEDVEIGAFLELEDSVYRAAATALRAVATNEVLVSKRIKFLQLSTDGPAEADALRRLADKYDESADRGDESSTFEIARIGAFLSPDRYYCD